MIAQILAAAILTAFTFFFTAIELQRDNRYYTAWDSIAEAIGKALGSVLLLFLFGVLLVIATGQLT